MANNPMDFMKILQKLQQNMGDMQGKLGAVKVTGSAGGDMVSVEMNGHLELLAVHISAEVVDPNDRETLEDLVRAAVSDAIAKIKEQLGDQFSAATGGVPIPPGLLGL